MNLFINSNCVNHTPRSNRKRCVFIFIKIICVDLVVVLIYNLFIFIGYYFFNFIYISSTPNYIKRHCKCILAITTSRIYFILLWRSLTCITCSKNIHLFFKNLNNSLFALLPTRPGLNMLF